MEQLDQVVRGGNSTPELSAGWMPKTRRASGEGVPLGYLEQMANLPESNGATPIPRKATHNR
jgi:hypothetical protein